MNTELLEALTILRRKERSAKRSTERLQSKKLWIISRKIKDCIRSYTKRLDILYKRLYNIISRLGRLSVSNQAY